MHVIVCRMLGRMAQGDVGTEFSCVSQRLAQVLKSP